MRRMKVVVMRITVVGFGMNSGLGCHTGCCEISVKADTTKLTNVAIAGFRERRDLVRKGKVFIKDEAEVASKVDDVQREIVVVFR